MPCIVLHGDSRVKKHGGRALSLYTLGGSGRHAPLENIWSFDCTNCDLRPFKLSLHNVALFIFMVDKCLQGGSTHNINLRLLNALVTSVLVTHVHRESKN